MKIENITGTFSFLKLSEFILETLDHIVQTSFQSTINIIEPMLQQNEIAANPDRFYSLIEAVCEDRNR